MSNPYHDEHGRFCSKGEMQAAVDRLADNGKLNEYFKLRSELEQLSQTSYNHVPKKNRNSSQQHPDQTIIPAELKHPKPVNELDAYSSPEAYLRSKLTDDIPSKQPKTVGHNDINPAELGHHPRPVNNADIPDVRNSANNLEEITGMLEQKGITNTTSYVERIKEEQEAAHTNGYLTALALEAEREEPEYYSFHLKTQELLERLDIENYSDIRNKMRALLAESYDDGLKQGHATT